MPRPEQAHMSAEEAKKAAAEIKAALQVSKNNYSVANTDSTTPADTKPNFIHRSSAPKSSNEFNQIYFISLPDSINRFTRR